MVFRGKVFYSLKASLKFFNDPGSAQPAEDSSGGNGSAPAPDVSPKNGQEGPTWFII